MKPSARSLAAAAAVLLLLALAACDGGTSGEGDGGGGGGGQGGGGGIVPPERYDFTSRDGSGASSAGYAGQTFRAVLIAGLKQHMGGLTGRIDDGSFVPAAGDVEAELDFWFSFDGATSSELDHGLELPLPAQQATFGALHAGTSLREKLAGNDPEGQHRDFASELSGWDEAGVTGAESLVRSWFAKVDAQAVARANGDLPLDPTGAPISKVFVTPEGHDLRELTQKFLDGAVTFSQAADDYLDDDLPGKGLNADHAALADGKPYTELEHAWDEGFGYFGAPRDLGTIGAAALAASPYHDSNGDGAIDLLVEAGFGHAVLAAKRDAGSSAEAPTSFAGEAFQAFLEGRALLAATHGPLDEAQRAALLDARDRAVSAWEKAIAAGVVHYANEQLVDLGKLGTAAWKFEDAAKHWSEGKGFALALQFHRRSPLDRAAFDALHADLGMGPALPGADVAARRAALVSAKARLAEAYGFHPSNVGDDTGTTGW